MSDDLYGDDAEVLEISEDAVRAWVTAWRDFAGGLSDLVAEAKRQSEEGLSWGDLESIQQLERIYRLHLGGGGNASLAARIAEFSSEAEGIAAHLESQFLALTDQDDLGALALDSGQR